MSWRVAALIALFGLGLMPAGSNAARPSHAAAVSVAVKPAAGSSRTHFAIAFRAGASGAVGAVRRTYRITASEPRGRGCQASASALASPPPAGGMVHVVLAPARSKLWCTGTFRGRVWETITVPCPPHEACPAVLPRPQMVGTFKFRVTRG